MDDPYITRQTLLLRACDPSDEEAWEEFNSYYHGFIQMVLKRLLFNSSDYEDLHQEILVKLWAKLKSYDQQKSKFRTWLSTVIRNTVLNYVKKKDKADKILAPKGEALFYAESANVLENHIQSEWETYASNLALEKIKLLFSEKAIQAFKLSLQDMSVSNIAKELDLTDNSVYKIKIRVISRLKEEIKFIRSKAEF
jgi:RNA polymerase sigma factor (sigma-70 family)